MKLIEVAVLKDAPRDFENPIQSIDANDPIFGEVFDAFDDAIYDEIKRRNINTSGNTPRENVAIMLQVRETMVQLNMVPIHDIIATEPFLDEKHLRRLSTTGNMKDIPILALYKGKHYVIDGNHRVVLELMNDAKQVKAKVLKL